MKTTIGYYFKYLIVKIKVWVFRKIINNKFAFRSTNDPEELKIVYQIRYDVYCLEKQFLNSSDYPEKLEKDKYDSQSIHFIVKDKLNNKIIATVRLITKDMHKLPIEEDFGLNLSDYVKTPEMILEISRFIVVKDYRKISLGKRYASLILFKIIFDYCLKYNYNLLAAVVDGHLLNILKKIHLPFQTIDKPKMYMGSESTPILINVTDGLMKLKGDNLILWEFIKH